MVTPLKVTQTISFRQIAPRLLVANLILLTTIPSLTTVMKRTLSSANMSESSSSSNEIDKDVKAAKAPRPNWFLAMQFDNPEIKDKMRIVQEAVIEKKPKLKPACTSIAKSHITLVVFHLKDDSQIDIVVKSVDESLDEFRTQVKDQPEFHFKADGLGNFR